MKHEGYVYEGLRYSFWTMCALWVVLIAMIYAFENYGENPLDNFLAIIWIGTIVHTIVLSIINLCKFRDKVAFAIVSLCISTFLFAGVIVGVAMI